ncbi:hypothetical protein OSB04_007435 [Centaurea solstitialis]|uniref:Reverse transcriptase zinc-binding domain-containing protein n=1 Tax=Centaurea solstitialis TaxID=347529 RepID=A0AA38TJW7_9ASTR|nr:hypothetical protein OSB04_007435 [Centaurea solstitialis]
MDDCWKELGAVTTEVYRRSCWRFQDKIIVRDSLAARFTFRCSVQVDNRVVFREFGVAVETVSSTLWSNLIPIKLNIFFWRFLKDALPTRPNL